MPQNIADFYRSVQQRDFARKFQFRIAQLANTNFGEDVLVYVEAASLPGRSINNVQVPFMGLNFNVPGTAQYPDSNNYQVRFRCDANYDIRAVLEEATFNVFDDASSTGDYNIARNASVIVLNLLNKGGSTIRQYTLYGAYVQSIGAMNFELGDNGTIQTIDTTLAYQYWRVTSTQRNLPPIV